MDFSRENIERGEVFLVDKPLDWTSFQVVNKIRWVLKKTFGFKKIKVGHAGTLDPKATGLLIICVGKKTKDIHIYQAQEKIYTGIIKLGATTPSYDTETEENKVASVEHINFAFLQEILLEFIGESYQCAPIFSAVKKDGKRLYEYAREGKTIALPQRKIHISRFEITKYELPNIYFSVSCSKGTYIRSLAYDFAERARTVGYLTSLRREQIGQYSIEDAYSVDYLCDVLSRCRTGHEN